MVMHMRIKLMNTFGNRLQLCVLAAEWLSGGATNHRDGPRRVRRVRYVPQRRSSVEIPRFERQSAFR